MERIRTEPVDGINGTFENGKRRVDDPILGVG